MRNSSVKLPCKQQHPGPSRGYCPCGLWALPTPVLLPGAVWAWRGQRACVRMRVRVGQHLADRALLSTAAEAVFL